MVVRAHRKEVSMYIGGLGFLILVIILLILIF